MKDAPKPLPTPTQPLAAAPRASIASAPTQASAGIDSRFKSSSGNSVLNFLQGAFSALFGLPLALTGTAALSTFYAVAYVADKVDIDKKKTGLGTRFIPGQGTHAVRKALGSMIESIWGKVGIYAEIKAGETAVEWLDSRYKSDPGHQLAKEEGEQMANNLFASFNGNDGEKKLNATQEKLKKYLEEYQIDPSSSPYDPEGYPLSSQSRAAIEVH